MKRYTVSQVRERFAEALDRADRGEPVVIERKGVRYSLKREVLPVRPARRRKSRIVILDPAVEAGQWTWDWEPGKMEFRDTRPRK
jgi:antitoxin (DNA-binding transcriptional repressor) of toxin-antitoxin stability system